MCMCVCVFGGVGGGNLEECQLFSRVLSNWRWSRGLLKGRAIKKHQPTPN